MKKIISLIAATLLIGGAANAQIVSNGTFSDGTGWTQFDINAAATITYGYAAGSPPSATATGGASDGTVLRIQLTGDGYASGVYTAVTLEGGHIYEVDGLAKAVTHTANSNWLECFLTTVQPTNGNDVTATRVTQLNSWNCINFDSVFLSCETLTNPGNANGQFTVPGSGSQNYYFVMKSGVCCSGGAAEILVDNVTITDLGMGTVYDTPPTPMTDNFNDNDDTNNYGGLYRAFAGGDPGGAWTGQDASMTAFSVDATDTTGGAGDYGMHVYAATPLTGQSYIYYGAVFSLSPLENIGHDLSAFGGIDFNIKLGHTGATTDWGIRLEDTSGTPPENFQYIDLNSALAAAGSNYTHVSIPLADFVSNADGGTVAPNLSSIKVITLVGVNTGLLVTDPDIYVDNLELGTPNSAINSWEMYN